MIVILLLIPLSIAMAAIFLGGFIWAVRSGQFEDTCTPALRLLADDSGLKKIPGKQEEASPSGNLSVEAQFSAKEWQKKWGGKPPISPDSPP